MIDAYFTIGNGAGLRTGKVQLKSLRSFFKTMLARPAIDLRSAEIQLAIDAHPAKVTAARAAGYIGPVIKWASKRDLMGGPFALEKPITGAPRQRVLSEAELRELLPTLDDAYGRCCLFLLLTAARAMEATLREIRERGTTMGILDRMAVLVHRRSGIAGLGGKNLDVRQRRAGVPVRQTTGAQPRFGIEVGLVVRAGVRGLHATGRRRVAPGRSLE